MAALGMWVFAEFLKKNVETSGAELLINTILLSHQQNPFSLRLKTNDQVYEQKRLRNAPNLALIPFHLALVCAAG
jgi:hypothetical protein